MKTTLKFLILAGLVAAGVALYLFLTRRKVQTGTQPASSLTGTEWLLSDQLQAVQLSGLAAQLTDKVSRTDVLSMVGDVAGTLDVYSKTQADEKYQAKVAGKGLSSNDYTNGERVKLNDLIPHKEVGTYADLATVLVGDKPILVTCLVDGKYTETESLYYKSQTKLRKIALIDEN